MKEPAQEITIDRKTIGLGHPTYFIADIGANHDGDLERAKALIYLAADAGADAAKFQHFSAPTIVSDYGFRNLGLQQSHQATWSKSVYEVYEDASLNVEWTPILKETCDEAGITFFTSPYSLELVDVVDEFVPAYKIGSGDITWHEIIRNMARKNKPVILATGASNLVEVQDAIAVILEETSDVAIMQCNTNYTASVGNYEHIHLNVLKQYSKSFPGMILGLSDHTLTSTTVLGAVALGARIIEKHFTDDTSKVGPDHKFSTDTVSWREMVERTREMELALGSQSKVVVENESETVVLQRRAVRATRKLSAGSVLEKKDLEVLRPCPASAIVPYEINSVYGKKTKRMIQQGEELRWTDLE